MARNLYILAGTLLLFALISCGMTFVGNCANWAARQRLAVEDHLIVSDARRAGDRTLWRNDGDV